MSDAFFVVAGFGGAAIVLASVNFRRYQITRPPVGVFNGRDVGIFLTLIVLVPYFYLSMPRWVVASLLAMATLSTLYLTLQPLVRRAGVALIGAVALVAGDLGAAASAGLDSKTFLAVNNLVLLLVVIGVTNLWAQSGMRARDVTILAVGLTVYDIIASSQLALMRDLLQRLSEVPLVPRVAWGVDGQGLAIGLGDMLLAAAFPLVMRKAFGRRAGLTALAVGVTAVVVMLTLVERGVVGTIPAMAALGPLMVVQPGLAPPPSPRAADVAVPGRRAPSPTGTDDPSGRWRLSPDAGRGPAHNGRREVNGMFKLTLRYVRYTLSSLSTVGFAISGGSPG